MTSSSRIANDNFERKMIWRKRSAPTILALLARGCTLRPYQKKKTDYVCNETPYTNHNSNA